MTKFIAGRFDAYSITHPENFVMKNAIWIIIELGSSKESAIVVDEFINQHLEEIALVTHNDQFRRGFFIEENNSLLSEIHLRFNMTSNVGNHYKRFRVDID